ncbi:MAG: hypothetical protein WEB06_01725 [Actinomycetota bacterium]
MAIDRHRESRLTRRLYETSIVFAFATLVALSLLLAVGLRTHGRFACAAKSIVAASAHCAGAAEIGPDLPSGAVNVVFSADPSLANAER